MAKAFDELKKFLNEKRDLHYLLSILNYDIQTSTPEKSIGRESELLSKYASELAAMEKNPEYIRLVKRSYEEEKDNPRREKLLRVALENIEFMEKVDLETYERWNQAFQKSNEMWRIAKKNDDAAIYLPYWKKAVEASREIAELRRKPGQKTRYDSLLSQYEPGETEELVDSVFNPLRDYLIEKLPFVMKKQEKALFPEIRTYDVNHQRELSYDLLKLISYDLDRGCLRESMHPFSDNMSKDDARITTDYSVEDWRSNLFTIIHEGGHCIEFQNWPEEQYADYVEGSATAALCETHSRFYENIIGRSKEFAPHLKALCEKDLGEEFKDMPLEGFYNLLNQVRPNLIRCDADEFTYSLHIIIRYEIEKDLINGKIEVEDVPAIWNKKYKDYLGLDVPNDREGFLQDVHWSDGSFGYFPSYALGNIYGAQILNSIKKDLPYAEILKNGDMAAIRKWFAEHDFAYDYLDPVAWINKVTGEGMNPKYFIDYLEKKFF